MNDGFRVSQDHARTIPEAPAISPPPERPTAEFVGASDETIGEAVRRALARAARAFRTLEGVGVLIVPQINRQRGAPRFRVTLKVTPPAEWRRAAAAPRANGTS
jgi:flavin-binding protein dodecin